MNELAIDDGAGRPVRSRSRIINHAARRAGRQYDGVVAWQRHWHSVCQSVPLVLSPLVGPTHQLQLVHFSLQFLQGRELPCGGSWNLELDYSNSNPDNMSSSPSVFLFPTSLSSFAARRYNCQPACLVGISPGPPFHQALPLAQHFSSQQRPPHQKPS